MKTLSTLCLSLLSFSLIECNSNTKTSTNTDTTSTSTATENAATSNPTAYWKIGVQMWTFRMFPFADALNKVDSAGVKYIEAFFDQKLGGGMAGNFGIKMSADTRNKLKQLLQSKGIHIAAMGVIS